VKNKVLFIINGVAKNGDKIGVSGGDIRLFEIINNTKEIKPELLTTPNGKRLADEYLQVKVRPHIINYSINAGLYSNLKISFISFFHLPSSIKQFNGYLYSSCEHLYDVLPALRLKLRNKAKWYAVYHWVEDYPWREKRGNTPWLSRYAYWLNRYVAGWIIKHFADEILAVSDQTKEKLVRLKKIKPERIRAVYSGVEYQKIQNIIKPLQNEKGKKYDAVFMKRLNYGKGVLDLLQIWKAVVAEKPNAKLAIIGDGSNEVLEKVNSYIVENNLQKNIDLLGVIYDTNQKFSIINSAKLFLLPTHEENWAIVIGEAMAAGVPVIVSRLKEIEPIWQDNVAWCEVGNINEFATTVLNFLTNSEEAASLAAKAQNFIPRYDWKNIASNELEVSKPVF